MLIEAPFLRLKRERDSVLLQLEQTCAGYIAAREQEDGAADIDWWLRRLDERLRDIAEIEKHGDLLSRKMRRASDSPATP